MESATASDAQTSGLFLNYTCADIATSTMRTRPLKAARS